MKICCTVLYCSGRLLCKKIFFCCCCCSTERYCIIGAGVCKMLRFYVIFLVGAQCACRRANMSVSRSCYVFMLHVKSLSGEASHRPKHLFLFLSTGISFQDYKAAGRGEKELTFVCNPCATRIPALEVEIEVSLF